MKTPDGIEILAEWGPLYKSIEGSPFLRDVSLRECIEKLSCCYKDFSEANKRHLQIVASLERENTLAIQKIDKLKVVLERVARKCEEGDRICTNTERCSICEAYRDVQDIVGEINE